MAYTSPASPPVTVAAPTQSWLPRLPGTSGITRGARAMTASAMGMFT